MQVEDPFPSYESSTIVLRHQVIYPCDRLQSVHCHRTISNDTGQPPKTHNMLVLTNSFQWAINLGLRNKLGYLDMQVSHWGAWRSLCVNQLPVVVMEESLRTARRCKFLDCQGTSTTPRSILFLDKLSTQVCPKGRTNPFPLKVL